VTHVKIHPHPALQTHADSFLLHPNLKNIHGIVLIEFFIVTIGRISEHRRKLACLKQAAEQDDGMEMAHRMSLSSPRMQSGIASHMVQACFFTQI
jgi:hypothetical protein